MHRLAIALSTAVLVSVAAACGAGEQPPLTPADVPAAFIKLTQAAERTMHMEWTGSYSMGGLGATASQFTATFDFSGDNFAGTMSASNGAPDGKPGDMTTQIALVDGQAYQLQPYSSGWQVATNSGMPTNLDPLRGLAIEAVEYVGQESREGATVHHLRVTDLSNFASGLFSGITGGMDSGPTRFTTDNSSFDIYVDSAARPLDATLSLSTTAQPTDFGAISMTSTYAFSNWNAEIYIVAPPVVDQCCQPGGGGGIGIPEKPPLVMP
jgi:hypothetical protein